MSTNFQVAIKRNNGNLHVETRGDFDGTSACQLIELLRKKYNGNGEVIIDTHNLRRVYPFGCSTFQCQLNRSRVPAKRLVFRGEKGVEIAPRGSKVILQPQRHHCRCNGNCENCPCSHQKTHQHANHLQ